jgi:hypothetical protein
MTRTTHGAAEDRDSAVNLGNAAHITAASPGGKRYDPSLTPAQRKHHENGIWLCVAHAKLVDADETQFPVDKLREWKRTAERRSKAALLTLSRPAEQFREQATLEAIQELIARLGLDISDDVESVSARVTEAARADIAAFRRMAGWPVHPVMLGLRAAGDGCGSFQAAGLAAALQVFDAFAVIAPPGTGKTTTLTHVTEALLARGLVGILVPLAEWSAQPEPLFQAIMRRPPFFGLRPEHLMLLASCGRLVLALDGWNELGVAERQRGRAVIVALRRDYPELKLVLSTRRQALDLPVPGDTIEIDELDEEQQREIALALRGEDGEAVLDAAWRTPRCARAGCHAAVSHRPFESGAWRRAAHYKGRSATPVRA